MGFLGKLATGLLLLLVLAYLGLFFYQRKLQYFPSHDDVPPKGDGIFVPWTSDSGEFLGYVRPSANPRGVVLVFHGNGDEALGRSWYGDFIADDKVILLAEYPGYGAKEGSPGETAIFESALRAYDEAVRTWSLPIAVVGESIGTGVASYVASERKIDRLGLLAPFTSAVDVAKYYYPYLPVSLLLRDRYSSIDHLRRVTVPLHVVHGNADRVVPFVLGKRLFESYAGASKSFTEIDGIDHLMHELVLNRPESQSFRDFVNAVSRGSFR